MTNNWDQHMASAEEAYHGGEPIKAQRHWILAVKEAEDVEDLRRASMSLDRLAEALRLSGNFQDAEGVLRMALEVKEGLYGQQHSEVIGSLNNLVDALHAQSKYDDALSFVDRLVDAYQITFGEAHPGVATIVINMATLYDDIKHPAAETFYKQAIAIKTKAHGYRNDEVVALAQKYAAFLSAVGREEEANLMMQTFSESVSGVWKTVAAKMTDRMDTKLSETTQKRLGERKSFSDKRRERP